MTSFSRQVSFSFLFFGPELFVIAARDPTLTVRYFVYFMFMDVYADTDFLLAIPYCGPDLHNGLAKGLAAGCWLLARSSVINPLMTRRWRRWPGAKLLPEIRPIMLFAGRLKRKRVLFCSVDCALAPAPRAGSSWSISELRKWLSSVIGLSLACSGIKISRHALGFVTASAETRPLCRTDELPAEERSWPLDTTHRPSPTASSISSVMHSPLISYSFH